MKKATAVGVIVLGGVVVAVLLLTVLGYMLAEEDELMHLFVSGLILGGIATLLIFLGVRLLSARKKQSTDKLIRSENCAGGQEQ